VKPLCRYIIWFPVLPLQNQRYYILYHRQVNLTKKIALSCIWPGPEKLLLSLSLSSLSLPPSKAAAARQAEGAGGQEDVGGELASRGGRSGSVSPHLPRLGFPSSLPPPPPNRSSGGATADLGRGEGDRRTPQGSGHDPAGAAGGGRAALNAKGSAGA
jgi:hypothetical protein